LGNRIQVTIPGFAETKRVQIFGGTRKKQRRESGKGVGEVNKPTSAPIEWQDKRQTLGEKKKD